MFSAEEREFIERLKDRKAAAERRADEAAIEALNEQLKVDIQKRMAALGMSAPLKPQAMVMNEGDYNDIKQWAPDP